MIIWRNLNTLNSIYSVFKEPNKQLAKPLGSAEPGLKNTGLARVRYNTSRVSILGKGGLVSFTSVFLHDF